MLFRPDRAYRDAVVGVLKRSPTRRRPTSSSPSAKGKPEAGDPRGGGNAVLPGHPGHRAAPGPDADAPRKPEVQDVVRRLLLEAPVTPALEPVLWQLASSRPSRDPPGLSHTSGQREPSTGGPCRTGSGWPGTPTRRSGRRPSWSWPSTTRGGSVDLLVEQLPLVDYATQQYLVKALTAAAAGQGADFADRLLPLIAAGEARHALGGPQHPPGDAGPPRGGEALHRLLQVARRLGAGPGARVDERASATTSSSRRSSCSGPRRRGAGLGPPGGHVVRGPPDPPRHRRAAEGPRLVDPDHRRRDPGPPQGSRGGAGPGRGPPGRRDPLERGGGPRPHRRRQRGARP